MKIRNEKLKIFLINFIIALILIVPQIIINRGVFVLRNDFSSQYIPFIYLINNVIKNGMTPFWNHYIDLGNNFLEINTIFWGAGNLVDLITLLFPISFIPYLIGPIMAIKFGLIGLTSSLYFEKHIKDNKVILLSSILYTFSGHFIMSLVFSSFYNVYILFPLLLLSFELLIEENKKGLFLVCVALTSITSGYFLIMEIIFLIIYFFAYYGYDNIKKRKYKELFVIIKRVIVESILGIMIGAFILFPQLLFLISSDRAKTFKEFKNLFNVSIVNIIKGYLMLPQPMNGSIIPKDDFFSSNSLYIPLCSIVLAIEYIKSKKDYLSRVIIVFFIISIVNGLNSIFSLMSGNYYRWYYMYLLLLVLATGKILEDKKIYSIKRSVFCIIFILILSFVIIQTKLPQYAYSLKSYSFITCVSVFSYVMLLLFYNEKNKKYMLLGAFVFITISYAHNIWSYTKIDDSGIDFREKDVSIKDNLMTLYNTSYELENDIGAYRYKFIDYESLYAYNNIDLINMLPSVNGFYSAVSHNIEEFYNQLGFGRSVFSYHVSDINEYLLGVKYVVSVKELDENRYRFIKRLNKYFSLYEVKNYLPICYLYDEYYRRSDFDKMKKNKPEAMLYTLIVKDEDVKKVEGILKETKDISIDETIINDALKKHIKNEVKNFTYRNNDFNFDIESEKEAYLYISIPAEKYFKAYVNDKETEILNINGLMAVKVNVGNNHINLHYDYYIFKYFMAISIIGILLTIIYYKVNISIVTKTNS